MKKSLLLYFLLAAHTAFAQPVATVLFTSNKVIARHNGSERVLNRGAKLETGDTLITTKGALANIKYLNGTLVNIGENTQYKILAYSAKKSDVQINTELTVGKIKIQTTGKVKESLKTPVVALAILGTELSVFLPAQEKKMFVEVNNGTVMAGNLGIISPGKGQVITPKTMTESPFPASGKINTISNAPGTIASVDSTRSEISANVSAETVGFIESNTVTTQANNAAIEAAQTSTQSIALAVIELIC